MAILAQPPGSWGGQGAAPAGNVLVVPISAGARRGPPERKVGRTFTRFRYFVPPCMGVPSEWIGFLEDDSWAGDACVGLGRRKKATGGCQPKGQEANSGSALRSRGLPERGGSLAGQLRRPRHPEATPGRRGRRLPESGRRVAREGPFNRRSPGSRSDWPGPFAAVLAPSPGTGAIDRSHSGIHFGLRRGFLSRAGSWWSETLPPGEVGLLRRACLPARRWVSPSPLRQSLQRVRP
jgi:hypothetical protein